jgi:hypothetical protein
MKSTDSVVLGRGSDTVTAASGPAVTATSSLRPPPYGIDFIDERPAAPLRAGRPKAALQPKGPPLVVQRTTPAPREITVLVGKDGVLGVEVDGKAVPEYKIVDQSWKFEGSLAEGGVLVYFEKGKVKGTRFATDATTDFAAMTKVKPVTKEAQGGADKTDAKSSSVEKKEHKPSKKLEVAINLGGKTIIPAGRKYKYFESGKGGAHFTKHGGEFPDLEGLRLEGSRLPGGRHQQDLHQGQPYRRRQAHRVHRP